MMARRLGRTFFARDALRVCREVLGKHIVRRFRGKKIIGKIVEVEAYIGPKDKASHAFGGKITKRNLAEYMTGGHVYIYLVYGMYWQFNISTGKKGSPECFLIRAVEPVSNIKDKEGTGPGRFCRAFFLNKNFYGEDLTRSKRLWLEDPVPPRSRGKQSWSKLPASQIAAGPRIGIDYAGPTWSKKPWRFYLKNNKFVS